MSKDHTGTAIFCTGSIIVIILVILGFYNPIFFIILSGVVIAVVLVALWVYGKWVVAPFVLFWTEIVEPLRKQGFSVLLTREYGIQLIAVLFTCFALCQLQIFQERLPGLLFVLALTVGLFLGGDPSGLTESEYSALVSGIISLLILIPVTTIPGFFVGLLTGRKDKGMNSVGIGSFIAAWIGFAFWRPEMFSWGLSGVWLILVLVLILIGVILLSVLACGIGMGLGYLGESVGLKARDKIVSTRIWKLKKREEAVAWELEDQLKELKEQMGRGVITQEEYEQKRKKMLEGLAELKEQMEYKQKKKKMLEKGREAIETWELEEQLNWLHQQLFLGLITEEEYEQKKKKLLEKSQAKLC